LARLFAEKFQRDAAGTLTDRQVADILLDMVTNKSSTKRGGRISVRLSESLIGELEATAEREHRPVSDYVRDLLIDAVAARIIQNEQPAGA
jgi:predicted DNA binding CopG/RHH family protein